MFVQREQLFPFLAVIAELAGYSFDDSDRDAIYAGLLGTDRDAEDWFDYQLAGPRTVRLRLAHDEPGSGLVWIVAHAEPELDAEIRGAYAVVSNYELRGGRYTSVPWAA